MSNDMTTLLSPVGTFLLCILLLLFTVGTALWLDGRANKKIRKAEQRRARSLTDE